jgi:alpha-glucosidase (family GH31 glycosyl hydrolase)
MPAAQDTMWTDIDYMQHYEDFSFDPQRFPLAQVQSFVSKLHANGQRYVVIVDPGGSHALGLSRVR